MKKLPLVLLVIVSLFVLAGCHGDKQYDDLLQQADSIMNINDDSAKVAIKLLDKAKPQLNDFSKTQRMRYQLLYHKAMNKADISFSSGSIMAFVPPLSVNSAGHRAGNRNSPIGAYSSVRGQGSAIFSPD